MDLKTRYVIKGIHKEQTITSKVNIFYDKATGKITKLEDKWDGKLPDSSFTNVSWWQLATLPDWSSAKCWAQWEKSFTSASVRSWLRLPALEYLPA